MGREVRFSFASDEEKQEFEILAKQRGLTVSQFVRWCVFKYRMDCIAGAKASRAYRARRRGEMASSTRGTAGAQ